MTPDSYKSTRIILFCKRSNMKSINNINWSYLTTNGLQLCRWLKVASKGPRLTTPNMVKHGAMHLLFWNAPMAIIKDDFTCSKFTNYFDSWLISKTCKIIAIVHHVNMQQSPNMLSFSNWWSICWYKVRPNAIRLWIVNLKIYVQKKVDSDNLKIYGIFVLYIYLNMLQKWL